MILILVELSVHYTYIRKEMLPCMEQTVGSNVLLCHCVILARIVRRFKLIE